MKRKILRTGWSKVAKAAPNCPNTENHTECPTGYLARHEWAESLSKTHTQIKCPGCNLYAIWIPTVK